MTTSLSVTASNGTVTAVQPELMLGYTASRRTNTVFTNVLGTDTQDVMYRQPSLRSGTLTFLFTNDADAFTAEALVSGNAKVQVSDTDVSEASMLFAANGSITLALDPDTQVVWTLAVDFQEVDG